ncbi:MAG: protein-L-isoaspartate(D-aspartate) O-methyltransferase [Deltaproteobacteria bacterium]|nr:protein-L-isoaspartate(D-aspartate) O-methyltransferase [Deltaproteobacteria bacterium]
MSFNIARKRMVAEQLVGREIKDQRVLQVMSEVPRHHFVDSGLWIRAYEDGPINIGWGATISQPYIVAFMLEALELQTTDKVLEIGTGCGYQTALLAHLAKTIYTIERVKELFFKARQNLKSLGLRNIVLKLGDGSLGWKDYAPYDAIVVAASAPLIPKPLLEQLAEGGRMILPVGGEESQDLVLVKKVQGRVLEKTLLPCRFVKLKGQYGYMKE